MYSVYLIFLFFVEMWVANTQGCLDHLGKPVEWWAILKVPPKIGKSGYGYIDSTFSQTYFSYLTFYADSRSTPLYNTLNQINLYALQSVAWNDEKPTGQVSTSMAHSKGVIAYLKQSQKGFFLSHSLPKYPAFTGKTVNITIAHAQNYYGQNLFCMSMNLQNLNSLAQQLLITRPYVYQTNIINSTSTNFLADLAASRSSRVADKYDVKNFITVNNDNTIKGIFKNGFENSSIFQDAMVQTFQANVIAETWGRPLDSPWCSSKYKVNNVLKVGLERVYWGEEDDHSKWAIAGSYTCFGDMNRMSSQWKRGGSFFCLNKPNLVSALRSAILQSDKC